MYAKSQSSIEFVSGFVDVLTLRLDQCLFNMIELSPAAQRVMGVGLAFAILSSVAVILRLLTKKETKASIALDDWWIIAALAFLYVTVGLEIRGEAHKDKLYDLSSKDRYS